MITLTAFARGTTPPADPEAETLSEPTPTDPYRYRPRWMAPADLPPLTSAIVTVDDSSANAGAVVTTLLASDLIDEVICVHIGVGTENLDLLRGFGRAITLVEAEPMGAGDRGCALAEALWRSSGVVVLILDATATGLTDEHIRALLAPVWSDSARAVVGVTVGGSHLEGLATGWIRHRLASERAYRRADLIPYLLPMMHSGRGVELFLNGIVRCGSPALVDLAGVEHGATPPLISSLDWFRKYLDEVVAVNGEAVRQGMRTLRPGPLRW